MEMEAFHEIGMEIERTRKAKMIIGMIQKEEAEMELNYEAEMAEIKNRLNRSAVKGNWEEVVRIYEDKSMAHAAKITKSGDTALHMAISDGQENIVEQLVEQIVKEGLRPNFTSMGNERGNTPLHLAASVGSVKMCKCIALKDLELLGARNDYGETPLFMAALHGKKDTFSYLHSICSSEEQVYFYCRRAKDGDTILHRAITGDYFDLAFHITCLYQNLVYSCNVRGFSPLHLLASKPSAFESGSNLGWLDRIIYHCINVDKLEKDAILLPEVENEKILRCPENYRTCLNFFQLLEKFVNVISRKKTPGNREGDFESNEERPATPRRPQGRNKSDYGAEGHGLFPSNYNTCFKFIKLVLMKALLAVPLGYARIKRIREEKQKHTWVLQLVDDILVKLPPDREYAHRGGMDPRRTKIDLEIEDSQINEKDDQGILGGDHFEIVVSPQNIVCQCKKKGNLIDEKPKVYTDVIGKGETPILVASKMGVKKMVEKILEYTPAALHDVNSDGKNLVHLATENRQPDVYLFLKETLAEHIFRHTDHQGNNALHLAARLGKSLPWQIPGPAFQMQWEIKWFQFIKDSMHPNFCTYYNNRGQTAEDIFTETHEKLVKEGSEWLTKTSELCSVASTVVLTVAFATSATVPGGVKQETGAPTFEGQPAFFVFAISSLIALCFSVISLFTFLSIYTSQHQEEDFGICLPRKLLLALASLLISVISMLVSFFASHFLVLRDKLKLNAYPLYAVSGLAVSLIVVFQFPWSFDVLRSSFSQVPRRSHSYKIKARPP